MNQDNLAIEVINLRKYFKTRFEIIKAVDGITFSVKKGELFGFLGPNGAGKTTMINILSGILKPEKGTATINGYDVLKDLEKVKEVIGVVPQEPAIFKYLNARENIELFGNLYLMSKEKLKERSHDLLKKLNLLEASTRKTKEYSGGMIRRLNLIIALINDPKIAFLDEPTVGMDPRARRATWEFIGSLKDKNKTIILTTHYIEEAQALCDRVAIIDYGKLIELGPPKELMRKYNAKNLEKVFMEITGRRILEGM
jgi:ABC-2 type transport system ATP-binding protein